MWGWDPGQGEPAEGGSSPQLVTTEGQHSQPAARKQEPVVIPDVAGLRQQFQIQQATLAHIKETLLESDADRTSKEKQLEMYTKKLAQIKNRSKGVKTDSPKKSRSRSREHKKKLADAIGAEKSASVQTKMSELKKCLQENKIKFEERTEKGLAETRKIESMVEQLRTQVQERDIAIHDLQKNMETPPTPPARPRPTVQTLPRRYKDRPMIISKWTQTPRLASEEGARIQELESIKIDLEDTIKQQESVIAARTRAITLLTENLSKKSKSTLDNLEDTRTEMREMQSNFVEAEMQLKSQLQEKDDRLQTLEEKLMRLQTENQDLMQMHAAVQGKLSEMIEKESAMAASESTVPSNDDSQVVELNKKIAQLEKELDDSNKLMIRLKLEQKQKLKAANKNIEKLKQGSGDGEEVIRLRSVVEELEKVNGNLNEKLAELEEEKGNLQLSLLDFDDFKASRDISSKQVEETLLLKNQEIQSLKEVIDSLEGEKKELHQHIEDQNILIDNLNSTIKMSQEMSFEIPGDQAVRHFDQSNESVHNQLEDVIREKQELLTKLKNLSSEMVPSESKLLEVSQLEANLTAEKTKVGQLEEKIACLEKEIASSEPTTTDAKGTNALKNKLRSVIVQLKKEKAKNAEMADSLKEKEALIVDLGERVSSVERSRKESISSCGEPDPAIVEIQQKYLSMEGEFLQLNEKYEHLRKENIELTGEKVRRQQALEEEAQSVHAINSLQTMADGLEERVTTLEANVPVSQPDLQYASIVIASNDTEIFNLQRSLANKTEEVDALNEQVTSLKAENADLANRLKEEKAASEDGVRRIIEESRQREMELSTALQGKVAECETYVSEYQHATQAEASIRNQFEAIKSSLEARNGEIKAKTEENQSLVNERNNLKQELHRLQVSIESVMLEGAQERAKIDELNSQQEHLRTQLMETTLKCEETENVLQKTWAERNELIQSREAILQHLKQVEASAEMLARERDEARQHVQVISDQLTAASAQQNVLDVATKELSAKQDELNEMTSKAKKLAANLKKKTQTEKELLDKVQVLNAENLNLLNRLAANQGLLDEINSGKSEKEILLQEQQTYAVEKQGLIERNEAIMSTNNALSQQLHDLQKLHTSLNEQLVAKEAEVIRISEELNTIQYNLAASREAHEKIVSEIASLNSENGTLRQKLADVEEKWTVEVSEKEALAGLHQQVCQQLKGLEQVFELEQRENESLIQDKATSLQELNQLKLSLEESQKLLQGLEAERDALLQRVDLMAGECEAVKRREELIAQLQVEKENAVRDLAIVNQSLVEVNPKMSHLQNSLTTLEAEREQLVEALSSNQKCLEAERLEKEDHAKGLEEARQAISSLNLTLASLQTERDDLVAKIKELEDKRDEDSNRQLSKVAALQKQVQNFDLAFDAEVEKNSILKSEIESLKEQIRVLEERTPKKKKSVTFTGEAAYIKELRGEVTSLHQALAESDNTVGELKAALSKEKADQEQITRTFDTGLFLQPPAGDFLTESADPADPFSEESLQWDDSWGAEGQLEADHMSAKAVSQDSEKLLKMETELKAVHAEREQVQEELRVLQVKYSKVVKKLKEQKLQIDQLQANLKTAKSTSTGFGDLDGAILDEMKSELKKVESSRAEIQKELETVKKEKDALLKQVNMLNAGNDRFIEMKERQDTEAAIWQSRNAELRAQLASLEAQLLNPPDDNVLAQENSELKNLIEGLEWKVSELTEMVEEKEETLALLKNQQQSPGEIQSTNVLEVEELTKNMQIALDDANAKLAESESQLSMLAAENDDLQRILNDQRTREPKVSEEPKPAPSTLAQWFTPDAPSADASLLEEIKQLKDELNFKNQEIEKINGDLRDAVNAAELEKVKLSQLLEEKEIEVDALKLKLNTINALYEESKQNLERLMSEEKLNPSAPLEELRLRDEEILALQYKVSELQKAYEESKIEIDRLLAEDRLGSITLLDDDRLQTQMLEAERAKYESMIAMKDNELQQIRQYQTNSSGHQEASHDLCRDAMEELKKQQRQWEMRTTQEMEEKELEIRELRAEGTELRTLLEAKHAEVAQLQLTLLNLEEEVTAKEMKQRAADVTAAQQVSQQQYDLLRNEYYKAVQYLEDKTNEIAKVKPLLDQKEAELQATRQELKSLQQRLISRESEITHEHADLESELLARDAEVRELRAERFEMDAECRELRANVEQLQRQKNAMKGGNESTEKRQDIDELSSRLQSDLDTALYTLHQRDVRCDELTFELMQLLEERDTLQLRLSNAIRENESLKLKSAEPAGTSDVESRQQGHLTDKISQLHNVGYIRDKNFQDETQQRHKEQMALISRQANSSVMDV